jgi:hypothetical protein
MKVQVTEKDVEDVIDNGIDNPVTRALQRVAGEAWFVFNSIAYELTHPYRSVTLPPEVCDNLHLWQRLGIMWPFEFEADITLRRLEAGTHEDTSYRARYPRSQT